jgi:NAD-dependent dihydropyrimidine dehydrogenase PreA subunit
MRELRYLTDVVTLRLDTGECIGCGICTEVCPHGVFDVQNGKAIILDRDLCMECGACEQNCPVEAISVRSGVGCAAAIITGMVRGTKPVCGCGDDNEESSTGCCDTASCC